MDFLQAGIDRSVTTLSSPVNGAFTMLLHARMTLYEAAQAKVMLAAAQPAKSAA